MNLQEEYGLTPVRAWLAALVAAIVAIAGAAVAFTEQIYWGFLWRYFWGPVEADAIGERCLVYDRSGGAVLPSSQGADCARSAGNFVAEPGYTLVSEVGYMVVLLFMLAGVYLLLTRIDLEPYREFFFALVPFMLFGGVLRVVEDSFVAARDAGLQPPIDVPWSALIISPFIYFTVFALALAALLGSKWLAYAGRVDTYYEPFRIIGGVVLGVSTLYLVVLSATTDYVGWYPMVFVVTMGAATAIAYGAFRTVETYWPEVNAGTGYMGLVVIWGHAIDGVANVIASDWTWVFGVGEYGAKHPINRIIVDVTGSIQPASLTGLVGDSWPFLVIKIAVAVAILSIFDKGFVEENPRYAIMLLGAIVAVGMGPGTRDMVRVTFGI
jgi:uncharacterized membrane protein